MEALFPLNVAMERNKTSKVYFEFAIHFLSVVIGWKKFENYCWKHALSKFVTVSDEAFALLTFENNYDCWLSMAINDNWLLSLVKPKYTSGGNVLQTPRIKLVDIKGKKKNYSS